ncbi:MAG: exopolysaccharide biosynthesis protein [Chromatocurvus sp.]
MEDGELASLDDVLDAIERVAQAHDPVSVELMMDAIGSRSFGALLLLAGLVVLAPIIGDVPTVPTLMALFVFLISGQLLASRDYFWLPRWLLVRSLEARTLNKAVDRLRRPARFVDRLLKPRLDLLIAGRARYAVAVACLVIAMLMPPMEFIPFSANIAGAALSLFGLALVGRDGLLALLAFALTLGGVGVLIYGLA